MHVITCAAVTLAANSAALGRRSDNDGLHNGPTQHVLARFPRVRRNSDGEIAPSAALRIKSRACVAYIAVLQAFLEVRRCNLPPPAQQSFCMISQGSFGKLLDENVQRLAIAGWDSLPGPTLLCARNPWDAEARA